MDPNKFDGPAKRIVALSLCQAITGHQSSFLVPLFVTCLPSTCRRAPRSGTRSVRLPPTVVIHSARPTDPFHELASRPDNHRGGARQMAGGGGDAVAAAAVKKDVEPEVVIVGGGIAGLATALALRRAGAARGRVGGGVLVLERHAGLRATGAALTIFPNGWFALRALGVAHKLTSRYDAYETSKVTNLETGATQVFRFAGNKDKDEEVRVRAVDRKALLEALAEELPPGTVRFSSKLVSIDTERAAGGSSETVVLRLDDGTVIRAKVRRHSSSVHHHIILAVAVYAWLVLSGPDRVRRRALGGGAVAGAPGAGELGPVLRPRALHLPRRPRHQAGAPAVPLAGSQGGHGAHQRHRHLLVPRQRHRPCRQAKSLHSHTASSSSQIHPVLRSSEPPPPHLYLQRKKPPGTRPRPCARSPRTWPATCPRSTWTWCAAPTTATSRGRRSCTGTRCPSSPARRRAGP
ncbi:hypothetical protein C2845_PM15G08170 [Panicum miliaceum]|uniref:FAD-binding domain-containing protein n=1 Tax=Panicum miliaceum TaxID=4540 RepID=A0A3L6QAB4_PANMI|nr:hypothetical protein C2845_PM15G08170 [Panicum miliaceum]